MANVSAKEDTAACCELLRLVRRPSGFMASRVEGVNGELVKCAGHDLELFALTLGTLNS
jgi:hypothetical protein